MSLRLLQFTLHYECHPNGGTTLCRRTMNVCRTASIHRLHLEHSPPYITDYIPLNVNYVTEPKWVTYYEWFGLHCVELLSCSVDHVINIMQKKKKINKDHFCPLTFKFKTETKSVTLKFNWTFGHSCIHHPLKIRCSALFTFCRIYYINFLM